MKQIGSLVRQEPSKTKRAPHLDVSKHLNRCQELNGTGAWTLGLRHYASRTSGCSLCSAAYFTPAQPATWSSHNLTQSIAGNAHKSNSESRMSLEQEASVAKTELGAQSKLSSVLQGPVGGCW